MSSFKSIPTAVLILLNIPLLILSGILEEYHLIFWIFSGAVNAAALLLLLVSSRKKKEIDDSYIKQLKENPSHPEILKTFRDHIEEMDTLPSIKEIYKWLLPDSDKNFEHIETLTQESITEISEHLKNKKKDEFTLTLWLQRGYEIITILEQMNILSRRLETESITDITRQFNEIWERTELILKNMVDTAEKMSSSQTEDGFQLLNNTADRVTEKIKSSQDEMQKFKNVVALFLGTNRENLSSILNTASVIQDIAEQIKIISINMRIEAAKLGSINSGFHVLGQEITKLADRTTKISESTTTQVNGSLEEVNKLEEELEKSFTTFQTDNEKIASTFAPMRELMEDSFTQLQEIIRNVEILTNEINNKAKGTMGKLQYSDITGQEMEHRLIILNEMKEDIGEHLELLNPLDEATIMEIRQKYLSRLKELCTTENEIRILKKFTQEDSEASIETESSLEEEGMLLF